MRHSGEAQILTSEPLCRLSYPGLCRTPSVAAECPFRPRALLVVEREG